MRNFTNLVVMSVLALVLGASGLAAQQMRFQGRLTGPGPSFTPTTVATSVRFRIYDSPTLTTPVLWEETQTITPSASGVFSTNLGATVPLTGIDFSQTLYLGIRVDTDPEMVPRYMLTSTSSSFYANEAGNSGTLDGLDSTAFALLSGANFTGNVSTTGTFSGNGSGLTNVNASTLGGLARSGFAELAGAAFTGNVSSTGVFSGNGSGLTNVNASTLGGLARSGFAELTGASFSGVITAPGFNSTGTISAGTLSATNFVGGNFVGNGSGLTNVNAVTLAGNAPSAFALLGAGSNTFSGTLQATTITATTGFSGNLTGNVTGNVSGTASGFSGSLSGDVTGTQGATLIANGAVTTAKILDGTITGADLNSAININTTGNIASRNAALADGDLTWSATAGNAAFLQLPSETQSNNLIRTPAAGAVRYNSGTSAVEVWNGTTWVAGNGYFAGSGLSLVGNTFNVSSLGITSAMLANDAVTTGKILDGTITGADLSGAISISTTGSVAAASFSGDGAALTNLNGANVTGPVANATTAVNFSGTLAGDVTGTQGATLIGAGAVTSIKILDGTITGADLNSGINITTSGAIIAGTYNGNGSGLTSLTAANVTGSLVDAQINNDITLNSSAPITGSAGLTISSGGANVTGGLVVSGGNITGNLIGNISGTSSGFTGLLAGDVIGTQGATVVTTVGGQTSANIALGVAAANNATNTNTPSRIVVRDGFGNFAANTISANLVGNVTGALTGNATTATTASNALALGGNSPAFYQDAANLTSGFLPDARLSGNIPRLGAASNTFTGDLTASQLFGQNLGLTDGDITLSSTGNAAFLQLPDESVSDDTLRAPANGALRYNSGTNTLELWDGLAWTPGSSYVAGTGLTLTGSTFSVTALGITTALLANDAITSGKILDGTITGADLANNISITTTGTFSGNGSGLTSLTGANVTGTVANATNAVNATTAVSFSGALAGDVTGTQGATLISNGAVNSAKIADGSIVGADLAGNISISTTGSVLAATFSGNGGSLTGLNAASITVGSLSDGQIDNNITLNANTLITGSAGLSISSGGANLAGGLTVSSGGANVTGGMVVTGGNISGTLIGNVTGNVTGSAGSFTGTLAGDVTGTQGLTVVSFVGGQTAASVATGAAAANAAVSTNTSSTIVRRDASGDFSANNITANLLGNATTATSATTASNALLLGGLARAGFAELTGSTFTGGVIAPTFSGNGAALTSLTGANVTGTVANATNATTAVNFSGVLVGDVTGTQGATVIANNAVTSAKIADGSITGADLNGAIAITTTGTYSGRNLGLTDGDLTLAITGGNSAYLQLPSEVISNGTRVPVQGALRFNSTSNSLELWDGSAWVTGAVSPLSITNGLIANDAVTSNKILDGTIVGADLAANIGIFTSGDMQCFNFTANSGNFNNLTAGNLVFTSGTITGNFTVLGNTSLNTLTTSGAVNINNTLNVLNATTLSSTLAVTGATTLSSTLGVTGATTLGSTLGVTGAATLSSTLDVTGATTLSSTLGVTGATTLSNTLDVTGATTLSSTLGVTGAATLSSTLDVTGATTLSSTLGVTGATTLSSTLGVTGATTLSSTLGVTGATTLSNTLGVTGATTLSSTLDVTGAATLSSTLGVTGATTLSSTLGVTGATTLSSTLGVTGATTLSSTLDVTGAATLSSTLDVTGNTSLSTLDTSGLASLESLDVTNNADVGGDFSVSGASTLDSLDVTNDTTVGGDLTVTGSIIGTATNADLLDSLDSTDFLQVSNNLSDLANTATARTNLGLGSIATQDANNVSITGGAIDGTAIGGTTAGSGAFTTLSASGQFTSTVAVGTAPFVVTSTTVVTNLNADLLDGLSSGDFLQASNNLSDLANTATARTNLGLGSIATQDANNVSITGGAIDGTAIGGTTAGSGAFTTLSASGQFTSTVAVGTAPFVVTSTTVVTNLNADLLDGLSSGDFLQASNNLSDLANTATARTNLGLGSIATQDANNVSITGGAIDGTAIGGTTASSGAFTTLSASGQFTSTVAVGTAPFVVTSTTVVTNLNADLLDGLSSGDFLQASNNLSDLANTATARTNLGLGSIATQNANNVSITGGAIDGTAIGGTTAAAGTFTSLTATGLSLGTGDISSVAAITGTGNWSTSGNISSTGSGTITSAGLLTASNGLTVTTGETSVTGLKGDVEVFSANGGVSSDTVVAVINDNGGAGTFTVTLPAAAAANAGRIVIVINNDANTATVEGVAIAPSTKAMFVSDGSNWR